MLILVSQTERVGYKLELDAISMLSAKIDVMSQRLEQLNINSLDILIRLNFLVS